ncbi:MAG: hypothetical protein DRH57_08205 [Candidatus Cloacimonadota bacterium]|nr:MAG: hypothetical protein DRH57_08205 [Candidatus Cloacimonadota bacterium]
MEINIFKVKVKQKQQGRKLSFASKVKLSMIGHLNDLELKTIMDETNGMPAFFGFREDIKDVLLKTFPEIITTKMENDSLKTKPRFKTIEDCEKQINVEVCSIFGKTSYPNLTKVDTKIYGLSRKLYCYAPNGTNHTFKTLLERYIEALDIEYFKENTDDYVQPTEQLVDIPTNITHLGYVYTISHKEVV